MINLKEISLFANALKIEEINISSRSTSKYKVTTNDGIFFAKIEEGAYCEKDILKAKWLYQVYQEENISVIPLIDLFSYNGNTIWIFPYFEGQTLRQSDISLEELKDYGKRVANDIKRLNQKKPDLTLFSVLDMQKHYQDRASEILNLLEDSSTKKELLNIMDEDEWKYLLDFYSSLSHKVCQDPVVLNHNDIKLPNIMIDKNKNYYFIDLDPFDLTVIGYNIGYSISCFFFQNEKEKEKVFIKSFIQTIDSEKQFVHQMNYFLISDFINKIERYLPIYQENPTYIKSLLFNQDNILSDLLY